MTAPVHTYGPTCLLYESESTPATIPDTQDVIPPPPKIRPQFFYLSSLPIDDPLTPVPPPTSGSSASQAKLPPRPFSVRDNIALEEAWQGLRSAAEDALAGDVHETHGRQDEISRAAKGDAEHRSGAREDDDVSNTAVWNASRLSADGLWEQKEKIPGFLTFRDSAGTRRRKGFSISHHREGTAQSPSALETKIPNRARRGLSDLEETRRKRYSAPLERTSKTAKRNSVSSPSGEEERLTGSGNSTPRTGRQSVDLSVSGSPFLRAPIRERSNTVSPSPSAAIGDDIQSGDKSPTPASRRHRAPLGKQQEEDYDDEYRNQSRPASAMSEVDLGATVTVGASRLHLVELPNLKVGFSHYVRKG